MSCYPRQSDCCCCASCSRYCNYMDSSCKIRRNRSCSDCFPSRLVPDISIAAPVKKSKTRLPPIKPVVPKPNGKRVPQTKHGKRLNFPSDNEPKTDSTNKQKCQCDPKQTKNKQNFQYQDLKKRMEVICEEAEQDSDDEIPFGSKNIQKSCADFLNIVHDTVLETVQTSVESAMHNYFMHTMEKIETLCSQMMRNECLLSKMYLDILDKLSQQSEKNLRQFKCLCQFIAETQKEASEAQSQKCSCQNCTSTEEAFVSLAREKVLSKGRRLSGNGIILNANRNGGHTRHHRDSDNDAKTDPSLTSCTNSIPLIMPKTQAMPSNEESRRNSKRLCGYSDSGCFLNSKERRTEQFRADENFKIDHRENRMEGGR
ncbi:uncharacterized protein [Eurosta solidaginis]|uniref:uncharacterized protein n=1 Tax=Eurosta solidaginis TaxID=178769 RepID=UPI003530CA42